MDAFVFLKRLIFFLPLPVAIAVAWHCRRRGKRFSRLLVYAPPFLLPVVFYFVHRVPGVDLLSPILNKNSAVWCIVPYIFSVITCGATVLLGRAAGAGRARLGALSLPELFCLHAGMSTLGLVFGLLLVIWVSCSFGRGC